MPWAGPLPIATRCLPQQAARRLAGRVHRLLHGPRAGKANAPPALRQLTTRHFYAYGDTAKSLVQPSSELRYLLPRLLELLAEGAELRHSTELILDRLGNCPP